MLLTALFCVGIASNATVPERTPLEVTGRWYTPDERSIIEIYDCGDGSPCGRVDWIAPLEDNLFTDDHNEDPELRGRPLEGVILLQGFRQGKSNWTNGTIYNPENGHTYRSKLRRRDDGSLEVQGCMGPFCKGMRWKEAQ